MKKMKKISSIQKKISISFLYMSAVFIMITALVVATAITHFYRVQMGERLEHEQMQLNNIIENIAVDANDSANKIIIQLNANRMYSLEGISRQEAPDAVSTNFIMNVATNNLKVTSDIYSINIFFNSDIMYSIKNNNSPLISMISSEFTEYISEYEITTKGEFYKLHLNQSEDSLYFCKEIRDIDTNSAVGIVFLELSIERLFNYYGQNKEAAFIVADDLGNVVVATGEINISEKFHMPAQSVGRMKMKETSWQYNWKEVPNTNWNLICLQDEKTGLRQIYSIVLIMIFFAVAIMVGMAFVTLFIAKRISKPIIELSRHMTKQTGNLPKPLVVPEENDEIATLYESFNSMLNENKELLESYKAEERQRNELELALMQSQIKPHFLYNTLDTIYCLAEMEKTKEASFVTKALADYYRQVLNRGEDKISLERELKALQQYLIIMETRYRNLISYEISCEEDLKKIIVPKMLLQPLVENAIYHGIKPTKKKGIIKVVGKRAKNIVEIIVSDNGVGMTQQRFDEALVAPDNQNQNETFGIHNIMRRLQLFYGMSSRLELRNDGKYTMIAVIIDISEVQHD